MSTVELKDCPFCEHKFTANDLDDAIYPINRERTVWQCGCVICTAAVLGGTAEEAVSDWNKRSRKDWMD